MKTSLVLAIWLTLFSGGANAQGYTPGTAAAAGRSDGSSSNTNTGGKITTSTGTSIVPSYNTTAPEQSYFGGGNGSVAGPTSTKLASCAGLSTAECVAINLMQQKASTANPVTINPVDPLVVNARSVAQTPGPTLGSTASIFTPPPTSACTPATTVSGTGSIVETCESRTTMADSTCVKPWLFKVEPWWTYTCEKSEITISNSTCEDTLNVTVKLVENCRIGDVIAEASMPFGYSRRDGPDLYMAGGVIRAYCDPALPSDVKIGFTIADISEHDLGSGANYSPPPDIKLLPTSMVKTLPVSVPEAMSTGPVPSYNLTVMPGSGCDAAGNCSYTFFTGNQRWKCPEPDQVLFTEYDTSGAEGAGSWKVVRAIADQDGSEGLMCVRYAGPSTTDSESGVFNRCPDGQTGTATGCWISTGNAPKIVGQGGPGGKYWLPSNLATISFKKPALVPQVASETWTSTCDGLKASPTCSLTGSRCMDGPSTRNIMGLDVTRQCWKKSFDYECRTAGGPNACAPLTAEPLCAQTSVAECLATAANGDCISFRSDYRCTKDMGPPPAVAQTGHGYSVVQDVQDDGACVPLKSNQNCTLRSSTCTDTADKEFFGFRFSKPCWSTTDTYTCPAAATSNCQPLVDKGCSVINPRTTCISRLPDGTCDLTQYYYECGSPVSVTTNPTATCDNVPYCINGVCYDVSRPSDGDFGKAVAMMEASRQAGSYIDPATFELFKGEAQFCTSRALVNCCKGNGGPSSSLTNSAIYTGVNFARTYAGSKYVYDILSASSTPSYITNGLRSLGATSALASNTFSAYGVTVGWGTSGFQIVAFDPWSFVAMIAIQIVVSELMSCEESDQQTAVKKDQGICENMGSWCSSRFLGSCMDTKQSYCCYNSLLAKAVSVQGKKQLGIPLGDPAAPNCRGLTIDEVTSLDFSRIDLSEFVASIVSNPLTSSDAVTNAVARLTSATPNVPTTPIPTPSGSAVEGPAPLAPPADPASLGEPRVSASYSAASIAAGQAFQLTTNTTNAAALTYECTGASPATGSLATGSNSVTLVADAGRLGVTTCRFTAAGSTGTATVEAHYTVTRPIPVVTAGFAPATVRAGEAFSLNISVSNAASVDFVCTGASPQSGSLPTGTAATPMTADAGRLGTTNCTFNARDGAGGITTVSASYTVTSVQPLLTAAYSASAVGVGQTYTLSTATTDAASLSYSCSGAMSASGSLPVGSHSVSRTAATSDVGLTTCTFTARSISGSVAERRLQLTVTP